MGGTHTFEPLAAPADNGAPISDLFASSGPDTTVLLIPSALYHLTTPIKLSHAGNVLATLGYPTFESGKQAILETRGEKEAIAVDMFNLSRTALKRVHARGCRGWGRTKPESDEEAEKMRKEGKLGWIEGGGSLIWMGGPESQDSLIEGCRLEDPRGWTAVHVCDWAIRPRVMNNLVGPCGQEASGGPWADGLSVAGKESMIIGNTVIDATDGAIVLFCAPGTTCANNTIIARGRDLLGAINMVDDFPFDRDYSNTRVVGNVIRTEGAYIRLGIGCGTTCWSPWQPTHTLNYGGTVMHNLIGPGTLGYGIALSGAKDWTALGNAVLAGTTFCGDTHRLFPNCVNAAPTSFLIEYPDRNRTINCQVQEEFLEGEASWLIGIEPGCGKRLDFEGGQIKLDSDGKSASGEGGYRVIGGRWEVSRNGTFDFRQVKDGEFSELGKGKLLWSSGTGGKSGKVHNPVLEFTTTGQLVLSAAGTTLWDPTSYLSSYVTSAPKDPTTGWASHPSLTLANSPPYLTVRSAEGNITFASSYEYNRGEWELKKGCWVAVAPTQMRGSSEECYDDRAGGPPPVPTSSRPSGHHPHHFGAFVKDLASSIQQQVQAPPPIPPRPTATSNGSGRASFLYLDPTTCQLILHSSASPTEIDPSRVHWKAPPNPLSQDQFDDAWLNFQGDGNLVFYAKKGEGIAALWASMTNGDRSAQTFILRGEGEEGGQPRAELRGEKGDLIWSSVN